MSSRIRLAVVSLMIVAGIGAAGPAMAHTDPPGAPPAPSCPSHQELVLSLEAQGFTAQAANVFAYLTRRDCCAAI